MPKYRTALLALVSTLLLTASRPASAHKMMAASRVHDDGTVLLQAFFPDGKPARGVRVEVHRPDGSLLLDGKTDDEGKLTMTPDGLEGQWTATFTGSTGHRTQTRFAIQGQEGTDASAAPGRIEAPPPEGAEPRPLVASPSHSVQQQPAAGAMAATESLIEKEPFPWVAVVAGLGFIFGLSALLLSLKLRAELREARRTRQ